MSIYHIRNNRFELRRYPHPGKYEGGLCIDAAVHHLSGDGTDQECGDVSENGVCYVQMKGAIFGPDCPADSETARELREMFELTPSEVEYLSQVAGAIIAEDSQGFVTVEYFYSTAMLDAAWAKCEAEVENSADEDGGDDENDE